MNLTLFMCLVCAVFCARASPFHESEVSTRSKAHVALARYNNAERVNQANRRLNRLTRSTYGEEATGVYQQEAEAVTDSENLGDNVNLYRMVRSAQGNDQAQNYESGYVASHGSSYRSAPTALTSEGVHQRGLFGICPMSSFVCSEQCRFRGYSTGYCFNRNCECLA